MQVSKEILLFINYYKTILTSFIDHKKEIARLRLISRLTKRCIKEANMLHKLNGRRYYVIKNQFDKPVVVSSLEIKLLKAKGLINKNVTFKDLIEKSLYHTK